MRRVFSCPPPPCLQHLMKFIDLLEELKIVCLVGFKCGGSACFDTASLPQAVSCECDLSLLQSKRSFFRKIEFKFFSKFLINLSHKFLNMFEGKKEIFSFGITVSHSSTLSFRRWHLFIQKELHLLCRTKVIV